jgi:signal-transduction protein with cAMP-binding, CBS, and nucleotidyltransferase domain
MVLRVKEIMQKPLTIGLGQNAKAAGEMMKKNRRYSLIAVKSRNPVGILTDSDLIKQVVAKNKKPSSVKIASIMSSPIVTIDSDEGVIEAARKMKNNNIKRLLVVKSGRIVGILELTDVARASPEMMDLLEYKIKMRDMHTEITEPKTSGICDSCGDYFEELENANGKWLCENCRDELEE